MCYICYNVPSEIQCNECTFECCYDCIYEWSTRSYYCPQCKQFQTYNIEYDELDTDDESIYDLEIYDPTLTGGSYYQANQEHDDEADDDEPNSPMPSDDNTEDSEDWSDEEPDQGADNYTLEPIYLAHNLELQIQLPLAHHPPYTPYPNSNSLYHYPITLYYPQAPSPPPPPAPSPSPPPPSN